MRSASTLSNPLAYLAAYNKGKDDCVNRLPYSNPYIPEMDLEKHDGYNDGFHDHYIGYYVDFQYSLEYPWERRYFRTSISAINFAQEIKWAQVREKTKQS